MSVVQSFSCQTVIQFSQSVICQTDSQSVVRGVCDVKDGGVSDCEGCGKVK